MRRARFVALHVPVGEAPTPFLPVGQFTASWDGVLQLDLRGEYTFTAEGAGTVVVEVNGTKVLDETGEDLRKKAGTPIKLKKGPNKISVHYQSPDKGDALLRLFWETEDFRREPIPWSFLRHEPANKTILAANQLRAGREALATHRCLKCHNADTDNLVKGGGMPELAMDGPDLTDIGSRLNAAWIARWVNDPHALRPTSTMPRVFADGDSDKLDARAVDIAAYLASLDKPAAVEEKPASPEMIAAGTRLFANLGCIACHLPPNKDEFTDEERKRIPLRDISAKWKSTGLKEFLKKPDAHYTCVRMPNFNLSETETSHLAAYLLATPKRELFGDLPKGDASRGKLLVQSAGCMNCHSLKDEQPLKNTLKAPAYADLKGPKWQGGCLAPKPVGGRKAPIPNLTEEQRKAIEAFALDARESLKRDSSVEFATRQLQAVRCNACHRRDDQIDFWSQLKDEADGLLVGLPAVDAASEPESFKADQTRPTLTWTGEKLKPEWVTKLISGTLPYKPRPYLRARMPSFPQRADYLARGLSLEHGCPTKTPGPEPAADAKQAAIGMQLAGKKRWGCVGCHDVGKVPAVGVFEAPGPNFMYITERLRKEYYERWLWVPTRLEPMTKMPQPYTFGQPSQIRDVLDGDAAAQIEAMWQYLLLGDKIAPPME